MFGTGGRAVLLKVQQAAAGGVAVVQQSILTGGCVTSACRPRVGGGSGELVFADCDASGERGWLVLRSAVVDRPLPQVPSRLAPCSLLHLAARVMNFVYAKCHALQARFSRCVVGLFVCEYGVRPRCILCITYTFLYDDTSALY